MGEWDDRIDEWRTQARVDIAEDDGATRVTLRGREVTIDDTSQCVIVKGGGERLEIPTSAIDDVSPASVVGIYEDEFHLVRDSTKMELLRTVAIPDEDIPDVGHRSEMQHAVVIYWTTPDGEERETMIARWSELVRARGLTFWLRHRLGLPVAPKVERSEPTRAAPGRATAGRSRRPAATNRGASRSPSMRRDRTCCTSCRRDNGHRG